MNIFILLLLVLSSMSMFITFILYNMHMFQLNTYKVKEELLWIKRNSYPLIGRILGIIISLFLIPFSHPVSYSIIIILNILSAYGNRLKKAKIPLKYTNRVKRMLVTIDVIYLILTIPAFFLNQMIFLAIIQLLCILSPFLILLSNYMNKPIEKMINQHYINDAKRILKSMPNLMIIGITGSYRKNKCKIYIEKIVICKI